MKRIQQMFLVLAAFTFSTSALVAEEAAKQAPKYLEQGVADAIWLLVAAFLVFFMQPGFALVESGFTRAKNAGNIIMKNLMDFSLGSIAFFIVGYGIMYGDTVGTFIGSSNFMLSDGIKDGALNYGQYYNWMFQAVFAATAATIVSGGMAERTKFSAYLIFSVLITAIIYPISGHWIWQGEGWLTKLGFHDFAGSTVVHSVGGWAAMMGALILGPRIGKYNPDGTPRAIPGHNIPLAALGVFILWFGWYGFNAGSTLAASADIGYISMNTAIAAAAGSAAAMFTIWIEIGRAHV